MQRPDPAPSLDDANQRLEWLVRNGATVTFFHEERCTYARIVITQYDGRRLEFTACVVGRDENAGYAPKRLLDVIAEFARTVEALTEIPF